jgi:hypothetical protein
MTSATLSVAALDALPLADLLRVAATLGANEFSLFRSTVAHALLARLVCLDQEEGVANDGSRQVVAMLAQVVRPPVATPLLRAALAVIKADVARGLALIPLLPTWIDRRHHHINGVNADSGDLMSVVAALADAVAADRRALLPALAALAEIDDDFDGSVDRREFDLLALSQDALVVVDEDDVPVVVRAMLRSSALRRASPSAARAAFDHLRAATTDLGDSSFRLCTETIAAALALPRNNALLDRFLESARAADVLSSLDCSTMLWLLHAFDASFAARGAEQWLAIRAMFVDAMLARRLPIDVLLAPCRNRELLIGRSSALCSVVVALLEQSDWLCEQSAAQLSAASLDAYDNAHECVAHLLECTADERRDVAARAARLLLAQALANPRRMARCVARLEEALLQVTRPDVAVVTAVVGALAAIGDSTTASLMVFVQKHLFAASSEHVCVGAFAARALLAASPSAEDREALLAWMVRALHESEFRGAGADALLRMFAAVSPRLDHQQRLVLFHASLVPFVVRTNLVRGAPRPPLFGGGEQVAEEYFQLMAFVESRWQDQLRDEGDAAAPVSALVECLTQFYVDMYNVQCFSRVWRAFGARIALPASFSLEESVNVRHDPSLLLRECRCIQFALDLYSELLVSAWGREVVCREDAGHQHGDELLACVRSLVQWRKRAALYESRLSSSSVAAVARAVRELPRALARCDAALTSVRSLRALSRALLALLVADDNSESLLDVLRLLHSSARVGVSEGDDVWIRVAGFAALCPELLHYLVVGCNRLADRIVDLRANLTATDEVALDRALSSCALCLSLLDRVFVSVVAAGSSDDALPESEQAQRLRDGRAVCLRELTRSFDGTDDSYDAQHRALFGFLTTLFGRVPERFLALVCLRALGSLTAGLEASCLVAQHCHAALALVYPLERLVVLQTLADGQSLSIAVPGDGGGSTVRFKIASLSACRQAFVAFCLQAVFRLLPPHRLQACDGGAASGFGSALMLYSGAVHDTAISLANAAREKATAKAAAQSATTPSKKRARKDGAAPSSVEHSTIRQLNSTTLWSFGETLSMLSVNVVHRFDSSKVVVLRDDDDDDDSLLNPFASLVQAIRAISLLHGAYAARMGESNQRDRGALARLCRIVPLVVRKLRQCVQWRATCGSPPHLDVSRASLAVLIGAIRDLARASGALVRAAKESKRKMVVALVPRAVAQLEQMSSECDRCSAAEHLESVAANSLVGELVPGEWAGVTSNVCDALVRDAQMSHIFGESDDADEVDETLGGALKAEDATRFRVVNVKRTKDQDDTAEGDLDADEDDLMEDDDDESEEEAPMVLTFRG